MRARFVCLTFLALAVSLGLILNRHRPNPAVPATAQAGASQVVPRNVKPSAGSSVQFSTNSTEGGRDHETYVGQRTMEIYKLSQKSDPDSLQEIMSELENPDIRIRREAYDAVFQFGSRDAIPTLQALADRTPDGFEKDELLDTIRRLKLPTLTEVRKQLRARQATDLANGIIRPPARSPGRKQPTKDPPANQQLAS